jgi:hypothetical protein
VVIAHQNVVLIGAAMVIGATVWGRAGRCSEPVLRAGPRATRGGPVAQFDLPLDQLRRYAPDLPVPDDLDAFWAGTLAETRAHDLGATFTRVDSGLRLVETYDVRFNGWWAAGRGAPAAGRSDGPIRPWCSTSATAAAVAGARADPLRAAGLRALLHGYARAGPHGPWGDPAPDPSGAPFHPVS